MTHTYAKIDTTLSAMEQEGYPFEDITLLRLARNCCKTGRDWEAMCNVVFVQKGEQSWQKVKRYQPSRLLRELAASLKAKDNNE